MASEGPGPAREALPRGGEGDDATHCGSKGGDASANATRTAAVPVHASGGAGDTCSDPDWLVADAGSVDPDAARRSCLVLCVAIMALLVLGLLSSVVQTLTATDVVTRMELVVARHESGGAAQVRGCGVVVCRRWYSAWLVWSC